MLYTCPPLRRTLRRDREATGCWGHRERCGWTGTRLRVLFWKGSFGQVSRTTRNLYILYYIYTRQRSYHLHCARRLYCHVQHNVDTRHTRIELYNSHPPFFFLTVYRWWRPTTRKPPLHVPKPPLSRLWAPLLQSLRTPPQHELPQCLSQSQPHSEVCPAVVHNAFLPLSPLLNIIQVPSSPVVVLHLLPYLQFIWHLRPFHCYFPLLSTQFSFIDKWHTRGCIMHEPVWADNYTATFTILWATMEFTFGLITVDLQNKSLVIICLCAQRLFGKMYVIEAYICSALFSAVQEWGTMSKSNTVINSVWTYGRMIEEDDHAKI